MHHPQQSITICGCKHNITPTHTLHTYNACVHTHMQKTNTHVLYIYTSKHINTRLNTLCTHTTHNTQRTAKHTQRRTNQCQHQHRYTQNTKHPTPHSTHAHTHRHTDHRHTDTYQVCNSCFSVQQWSIECKWSVYCITYIIVLLYWFEEIKNKIFL